MNHLLNRGFFIARSVASTDVSASNWFLRPWYAKLWWSAIPVWWAGKAAATTVEPLAQFYDSSASGFLNVLFFPMTALLVLGLGFARHWLGGFLGPGAGMMAELTELADAESEHVRAFEDLNATTDIHDPRSGGLYVGNPFSLQHPGRH